MLVHIVISVLQRGRADILQQNNAMLFVTECSAEQHLDTRLASACDYNFN